MNRWASAPERSPLSAPPNLAEIDAEFVDYELGDDELIEIEVEPEDEDGQRGTPGFPVSDDASDEKELQRVAVEREEYARRLSEAARAIEEQRQYARVEAIREWFLENFEPPAPVSKYDEYLWGGPYDVVSVVTAFFPEYADDSDLTSALISSLERTSGVWVPVDSRLEPTARSAEPRSPEEAYARTQDSIRLLTQLLDLLPEEPVGMGHNRPPEPIDDAPLTADDRLELSIAVRTIASQPFQPVDNGAEARAAAVVVESQAQKIRSWLARQGDVFATEAFKEAGRQFGKWMPRAFWLFVIDRMFSVTENVTHWLKLLF